VVVGQGKFPGDEGASFKLQVDGALVVDETLEVGLEEILGDGRRTDLSMEWDICYYLYDHYNYNNCNGGITLSEAN